MDCTIEHAVQMSNGDMCVRNDDPEIDEIFPLDQWIKAKQRHGGKVYRRTVEIVDDWAEVE